MNVDECGINYLNWTRDRRASAAAAAAAAAGERVTVGGANFKSLTKMLERRKEEG